MSGLIDASGMNKKNHPVKDETALSLLDLFKFGCTCRQKGNYLSAINTFSQCLKRGDMEFVGDRETSFFFPKELACRYNLASSYLDTSNLDSALNQFNDLLSRVALILKADSFSEDENTIDLDVFKQLPAPGPTIVQCTFSGLCSVHLKLQNFAPALLYVNLSLKMQGRLGDKEDYYNYNLAMRGVGRIEEAIGRTWDWLGDGGVWGGKVRLVRASNKSISFCCVKYGTKYGAEYVNNLWKGLRKYNGDEVRLVCFTEDRKGVEEGVEVVDLPKKIFKSQRKDMPGWWYKSYIFSSKHNEMLGVEWEDGYKCYIDLDSVILGNLESMVYGVENVGILSTNGMVNENRTDGFNSSVVVWGGGVEGVYDILVEQFSKGERSNASVARMCRCSDKLF
ncbi:hypothetical protein TL16_g09425 [Triparma laevis f. inornata]|uniref:Uncharacterized protein n=1 Tax=Triparma laevis f. inornata TaxID=1714386 RepID=A0A9W7B2V6_9STRA|nr:hypothetical protein TL16_g09425 [Triparma laevis f. inornata]